MIKELNELDNIYRRYNSEYTKLYSEKKVRKAKIEEEIQQILSDKLKELNDDIQSKELDIDKRYSSVLEKRSQLLKDIHTNSNFKINVIGPILARLISEFEGRKYTFERGLVPVTIIEFYENYVTPKSGYMYNCALITDRSLAELKRKRIELFPSRTLEDEIAENELLLYSGICNRDYINFYDKNGVYTIGKKYPYVKDFIDTLIVSRMDNSNDFDPNTELDIFIKHEKNKVKKFGEY